MTIMDFPLKFLSNIPGIENNFAIFTGQVETLSRPDFDQSQSESRRQDLLRALRKTQDRLKELLSPDQDLLWVGALSQLANPLLGITLRQERLARLVKIENKSYIVNLHRTYTDILGDNEVNPREVVTALAHTHPWGDMAVAIYQGRYHMGVGIGELTLPPNIFIEGIVETGDTYFMSKRAYHGIAPLTTEICSLMVHKRMAAEEYGSADFSGIAQLSSESKSRLFNYFRRVLC
jgi:hypothetical protein